MSSRPRRGAAAAVCALAIALLGACSDGGPSVSQPTPPPSTTTSATSTSTTTDTSSSSTASTTTAAPSPTSSSVDGTRSELVMLCGDAAADQVAKACRSKQPSVSGNVIYCSALLPGSVTGNVDAVLYRNGSEVFKAAINRTAGMSSLMLNYSVGRLTLAGGTYACKFTAGGQTWVGETTVNGPDGQGSQGMACDGATMYTEGGVTHCTSNTPVLSSPSSLGCSGLVTDLLGRRVEAILHTPQGSKTATLANSFNLGSAVVHLRAPRTAFPSGFPTGAYRCEFLVDGQNVLTVPFSVS